MTEWVLIISTVFVFNGQAACFNTLKSMHIEKSQRACMLKAKEVNDKATFAHNEELWMDKKTFQYQVAECQLLEREHP